MFLSHTGEILDCENKIEALFGIKMGLLLICNGIKFA